MKEEIKRIRHKYDFKKKCVQLFLSGEKSKKDILNEYNLSEFTFNYWIYAIFRHEDFIEMNELKNEISILEEENKFLKKVIRIFTESY
jgi:transposase-like protein